MPWAWAPPLQTWHCRRHVVLLSKKAESWGLLRSSKLSSSRITQPSSEGIKQPPADLGLPMCSCASPQPVCCWDTQSVSKRTWYNSAITVDIKSVLGLSGTTRTLLGHSAGGGFLRISSVHNWSGLEFSLPLWTKDDAIIQNSCGTDCKREDRALTGIHTLVPS